MPAFVVRRLAGMVAVLFAVSVIVFLIFNVIPNYDPAQKMAGRNPAPQLVESIREEWGFDDSLPQQYLTMMGKILSGDVISYEGRESVSERIGEGVPATFSLCIGAAIIWMLLGIALGYLSAVRSGGLLDKALTVLAVAGISVPAFWLAAILLNYLAYETGLFPGQGYVELSEDPLGWAHHLILPWLTLAVTLTGFYSRVLRSNMLDAMNEGYVRTARAKGLGERAVRRRHVFRNSLIPIVTLFGLDFGALIGGSAILTEAIFNLNGVGQYLYESIENLDLPPIMAITLFGAFFVVLFNTLVDIAYGYLDPRVKLGSTASD
jgi:peptide/nickel transport system permease protein